MCGVHPRGHRVSWTGQWGHAWLWEDHPEMAKSCCAVTQLLTHESCPPLCPCPFCRQENQGPFDRPNVLSLGSSSSVSGRCAGLSLLMEGGGVGTGGGWCGHAGEQRTQKAGRMGTLPPPGWREAPLPARAGLPDTVHTPFPAPRLVCPDEGPQRTEKNAVRPPACWSWRDWGR